MEGQDYQQQYNDNEAKIENCCGYARGIRNVKGWLVDVHETFFQHVQMTVIRAHSLSTHRAWCYRWQCSANTRTYQSVVVNKLTRRGNQEIKSKTTNHDFLTHTWIGGKVRTTLSECIWCFAVRNFPVLYIFCPITCLKHLKTYFKR